jgi:hypothetical protein
MMKNQHEGEESSPPRFSARNSVEKHNSAAATARGRKQIVATFLQN